MNVFLAFLLVVLASYSVAQPSGELSEAGYPICVDVSTSAELDECVREKTRKSKSRLYRELENLELRVKSLYSADSTLGKELVELLYEAQDAWVSFRDESCKVEAFELEKDTPAYATTINACVIRMNTSRTEEIKELLRRKMRQAILP
jgi:uncharacterized protein YecT (DUF1311 family)